MGGRDELGISNKLLIRLIGLLVGVNAWALTNIYDTLATRTTRVEENQCSAQMCTKLDNLSRDHGERLRGLESSIEEWRRYLANIRR